MDSHPVEKNLGINRTSTRRPSIQPPRPRIKVQFLQDLSLGLKGSINEHNPLGPNIPAINAALDMDQRVKLGDIWTCLSAFAVEALDESLAPTLAWRDAHQAHLITPRAQ
jgi:hypothetical protein